MVETFVWNSKLKYTNLTVNSTLVKRYWIFSLWDGKFRVVAFSSSSVYISTEKKKIPNKPQKNTSLCNTNRIRQQFTGMTQLDFPNAQMSMIPLSSFNTYSDFMVGFKQITHQVNVCFLFFLYSVFWVRLHLQEWGVRILTSLGPTLVSGTLISNKCLLNK